MTNYSTQQLHGGSNHYPTQLGTTTAAPSVTWGQPLPEQPAAAMQVAHLQSQVPVEPHTIVLHTEMEPPAGN